MLTRSTGALIALMAAGGLSACKMPATPTNAVPCVVLTPRTDALRQGLLANPDTADAVGEPATAIILGTEAVC